ncbi:hypothetical protein, variant 1 [Aphanomyces invadans]|uniref:Uncharacterized protein n=2 Tax=Aphanomyces invadans TaxID=157072 RepID=A0A024ULJ7_9STRA|nr:hypothetical protein, variant 1 [Aphanomyces invadans]ETW07050.1 hypothetical protein, variant 1 [Aphanomyces invadans]|eukprot:XP_008865125.1 hypothetical protein, variant 1 [Aphanomyces invadans]
MPEFRHHLRVHSPSGNHAAATTASMLQCQGGNPTCVRWRDASGKTSSPLRFNSIAWSLAESPPSWSTELAGVIGRNQHSTFVHLGAFSGAWLQDQLPKLLDAILSGRHGDVTLAYFSAVGASGICDHFASLEAISLHECFMEPSTSPANKLHVPLHVKLNWTSLLQVMQSVRVDPEDHLFLQATFDGTATATICSVATMVHPSTGVCFPWYTSQLRTPQSSTLVSSLSPHIHRSAVVTVWTIVDCSQHPDIVRNAVIATFKLKTWLIPKAVHRVETNVEKCADASAMASLAKRRQLEARVRELEAEKDAADASTARLAQKLQRAHTKCDHLEKALAATQAQLQKQEAALAAVTTEASRQRVQQEIEHDAVVKENEWLRRQMHVAATRADYVASELWAQAAFKRKWLQAEATCRVLRKQLALAKQLQ